MGESVGTTLSTIITDVGSLTTAGGNDVYHAFYALVVFLPITLRFSAFCLESSRAFLMYRKGRRGRR